MRRLFLLVLLASWAASATAPAEAIPVDAALVAQHLAEAIGSSPGKVDGFSSC